VNHIDISISGSTDVPEGVWPITTTESPDGEVRRLDWDVYDGELSIGFPMGVTRTQSGAWSKALRTITIWEPEIPASVRADIDHTYAEAVAALAPTLRGLR
jgi:hypothetical protein